MSGIFECRNAAGLDLEVPFGFTAALGGRLADPRRDQSLPLEALEGRVDRADRGRTTRHAFDFGANHRPIRTVAQTEDDQQNDMLEFAEVLAFCSIPGSPAISDGTLVIRDTKGEPVYDWI